MEHAASKQHKPTAVDALDYGIHCLDVAKETLGKRCPKSADFNLYKYLLKCVCWEPEMANLVGFYATNGYYPHKKAVCMVWKDYSMHIATPQRLKRLLNEDILLSPMQIDIKVKPQVPSPRKIDELIAKKAEKGKCPPLDDAFHLMAEEYEYKKRKTMYIVFSVLGEVMAEYITNGHKRSDDEIRQYLTYELWGK